MLVRGIKSLRQMAYAQKNNKMLVFHIFEDRAGTKEGDNIFLMFEGRQWTYTEFYHAIIPVANWLIKDLGVQKGDMIALNGTNSAEYLLLEFAIEAVGASTAFINHNLTDKALVHCVKLCNAKYMLASQDVQHLVAPVEDAIRETGARTIYYDTALFSTFQDKSPLPKERQMNFEAKDVSNLLFTSGTTGELP
jgi:acyl-CoA synthetase (AMP-forming)/AMP-acid ligase II